MPNGTGNFRNFQISRKKANLRRLSTIFETNFQKRSVPFDFVPEFPEFLVKWIAPLISSEIKVIDEFFGNFLWTFSTKHYFEKIDNQNDRSTYPILIIILCLYSCYITRVILTHRSTLHVEVAGCIVYLTRSTQRENVQNYSVFNQNDFLTVTEGYLADN